ncbi:hypothetical protein BBF96_04920 [Anoxybacter fermentans]|uniref:Uncharacterized protein n=1 Tax=Anoxybacter fermentans TaxID=1323375 RepID=A0A3S9SWS4_9FIRM|nr:hypothetical protein [Anoxybacter fermentans]AZR72793.1 hypothetical protein BBF96_04920 [Anoxybacter fermentans]
MFGVIFNLFIKWMVIFLTGIVIKLMDDYLDQELDKIEEKQTLAMILDKAILPYTLLAIVVCMALRPALSGSLFLASYLVGMGHDLRRILPIGWNALEESIIFGVFGILIFGIHEMIGSFTVILSVQLFDDLLDYYTDAKFSRRNFVIRFGFWESIIFCLICLITAIILDVKKTFLVFISLPIVLTALEHGKKLITDE